MQTIRKRAANKYYPFDFDSLCTHPRSETWREYWAAEWFYHQCAALYLEENSLTVEHDGIPKRADVLQFVLRLAAKNLAASLQLAPENSNSLQDSRPPRPKAQSVG
jgi:hypothetical protein